MPLAIALVTAAVFARGLGNDFVEWDDHVNFVENPNFRGLAWTNLKWMFTTALLGQWIPLTWMTLGLDYVVWGMNPFGYHLTSLLLHTLAAVIFSFVATRLLRAATDWSESSVRLGATAAALFFAIHPLRVESVAWVTERRDVLSGLWFLLTVLTYLKAQDGEDRRVRWLGVSVGCFGLAVLSKAMVVTLPAILLLLDIYPVRRLSGSPRAWLGDRQAWRIWLEKLPYVALAAVGAGMAFWAQGVNEYLTPLARLSIADRLVLVIHSLWFYPVTTVMPLGLMPAYELPPHINPLDRRFVVSALGVVVLTTGFVLLRRRWPAGLATWAAYAIMLSPVSGIFHNGHQLVNDRYSYLPCLGWALLFAGGLGAVRQAGRRATVRPALARLGPRVAAVVLIGHAVVTINQIGSWQNTDSLWRFSLERNPRCALCHLNLGAHLLKRGRADLALAEFQQAAALRPDRVQTNGNIGLAYLLLHRPLEAMPYLQRVLQTYPRDLDNRCNLAVALIDQGRAEDAVWELQQVLGQDPNHFGGNVNMGLALIEARRAAEALPYLQRVVELKPEVPQGRAGLVRAWLALGRPDLAVEHYVALRRLDESAARRVAALLATEWW